MVREDHPLDDWKQRLDLIMTTMREMSQHSDPQAMVRAYGERIQQLVRIDRRLSLSRRGLQLPAYRITRSTTWTDDINPWKEKERLPLFRGGLLGELIYRDEATIIDDLTFDDNEPAAEYLAGHRSLVALPMFDQGQGLNMVILLQREPHAFDREQLPELVWRSNLFGRATSNLVLKEELQRAFQTLDREMKIVGDIQRSLLPNQLPKIPTLDLAAYYQPAQRAGGDYYDFFPLPDNKWGIFIADVSGHGTPAAVFMAVTHCIAHTRPGPATPPADMLRYLNQHLATHYTHLLDAFVTAFYGIYDPVARQLNYACAGHNPPRLKRCQDGTIHSLNEVAGIPLGILPDSEYTEATYPLKTGDQIIFYTDGITEAHNPAGELYSLERLDLELENCSLKAEALLQSVLRAVKDFADGVPPHDDQTLIVARVV